MLLIKELTTPVFSPDGETTSIDSMFGASTHISIHMFFSSGGTSRSITFVISSSEISPEA